MNNLLYKTWINALRSGVYTPAREKLRDEHNNFCCLGVVCDLYTRGYWSTSSLEYIYDDIPSDIFLPTPIQKALNIRTRSAEFNFHELSPELRERIETELEYKATYLDRSTLSLVALNDVIDLDIVFPIIADILEEAPPSLFNID